MIKKSIIGGAVLLLILGLTFGRDTCSYVRTSLGWMKDSVRNSVPVEFQLERARKMITDLKPEIRRNMHLIFKEEVEVERLQAQIDELQKKLDRDRDGIMQLKASLETGGDYVYVSSRRYPSDDVKAKLANRFARFKTNEGTLVNLQKVLSARQRGLDAARRKLEEMLAQKQNLIVNVENLEARQKMVSVAQTTSDFNFDDSHLARTKDLITDIETRIKIDEKLVNAELDIDEDVILKQVDTDDLLQQVTEHFGESATIESFADAS